MPVHAYEHHQALFFLASFLLMLLSPLLLALLRQIHYHKDMGKYKVKTMPNMTPERVSSILTDPTWTKAVFLRDPAERLLSCFLDKIVHRK